MRICDHFFFVCIRVRVDVENTMSSAKRAAPRGVWRGAQVPQVELSSAYAQLNVNKTTTRDGVRALPDSRFDGVGEAA